MARQVGDIKITGTVDDITFYKMGGNWYARTKSSLTRKRVLRDPAFQRTMQSAHRLARGSQLASRVYRALAKEKQQYGLYCELKRRAIMLLKQGREEAEVLALLREHLMVLGVIHKKAARAPNFIRNHRVRLQVTASCLFIVPKIKSYRKIMQGRRATPPFAGCSRWVKEARERLWIEVILS